MRRIGYEAVHLTNSPALMNRWSARAIKTFGMAELEARKLKYPTTGTEALLMGLLTEGESGTKSNCRSEGERGTKSDCVKGNESQSMSA